MSTLRGLDVATLSLKDALDLAILIEEEAHERYEELADQMDTHHNPDTAAFFRTMAGNEDKHRRALAARRHVRFGQAPMAVTRAMLFDVEAPGYDEARAFMTVRTALGAALRSEEKAHAFFVAALPRIRDAEVHALFEELSREEIEHQTMVRHALAAAPPDPAIAADDLADEPVGQ